MRTLAMQKEDDVLRTYEDAIPEQTRGFLAAENFQQLLYLERKRRERSGKPLYLLLIDVMRIADTDKDAVIRAISRQLSPLTRETDIKGWYSDGQVVGILFTEFNTFDAEKMVRKIGDGLKLHVSQSQRGKIALTIHEYPTKEDGKGGKPANAALYPEVRKKYGKKGGPFIVKRAIDIVGSVVGLVLFSPFFLLISVLVKLSSRGPVLFRQERVGLYGDRFTFLKFRTMYVNNDPSVHQEYVKNLIAGKTEGGNGGNGEGEEKDSPAPVYKIKNDKRVTRIGQILRKTSLDELPQFVNVLIGDMSLVGPRPPIPYEVQNYDIWHRSRVFEVKPGITGLWQVKGRSSTTFDEMVRLDIKYSREWSVWLDLKILAMTPWAVVRGKGAY